MQKCSSKKGQGSIEFLVILAAFMVVLTVVFFSAWNYIIMFRAEKKGVDTRSVLESIRTAAREVYSQGVGARKYIFLSLPSDYNPGKSYISKNTLVLTIGNKTYLKGVDVNITGKFPPAPGAYNLEVLSRGRYVVIKPALVSYDTTSIGAFISPGGTKTYHFKIFNSVKQTITITTISPQLSSTASTSGIVVTTSPSAPVTIPPGLNQTVDVTIKTSTTTPPGWYSGVITVVATNSTSATYTDATNITLNIDVQ